MRPIDRGTRPLDKNGEAIIFPEYSFARGTLIERLGEYCSYCEMHLDSNLAVEHVRPKVHHHEAELDWENFLLSCVNCNSTKSHQDINPADYFWPDVDNTALAIQYLEGGLVKVNPALTEEPQAKALRTIELTGLDRIPSNNPQASDRRWQNRYEAWEIAVEAKTTLEHADTAEVRQLVVRNAQAKGYWSIWMTVFCDDEDIRRRLVESFPGTSRECFDAHWSYVHRPTGSI
jgi:uncharacterized protein (TIGR02646 family)